MTQHNGITSATNHTTTDWRLETQLVHGGRTMNAPDGGSGNPTVHPIYASTTYTHNSLDALDQAFSGVTPEGEKAFVYARQGNPNAYALENAIARVEKGVGAVACSSGMAAIHVALLAAGATTGATIVASQDLYGPTITLMRKLFTTVGARLVLTDLCSPEALDLIREEQPDIIYAETVSNPLAKVVDLDAISAVAKEVGAISVIDSTFSTPYLTRPIEHGFDLVLHSATKYIGGHGDSTGGIVISATNVLLDQLRDFNTLTGPMLSPFESHLMLRGLRTLSLRMEKQCDNALQIARFLQSHPAIDRVHYPGLEHHPQHELASRQMDHQRFGGLLSFELKGQSREAAFGFMDRLELCLPATSLGDVFTLVSYPPMSSHRPLTSTELHNMGITEGCIRLSAGIEHIDDIIADLNQALA
ncbi:MAG TPA: PLP-dependent aspartate aminotransferase family protein [Dictyobacter sp.]|jgi:cystathionine gamma-synthase/methionine-gamma-lyase|nr:PLP-dependent aspartate aminotransferase family protein [Dictyobacter sp.]